MASPVERVYICNSVVNDFIHGNFICKSEENELPVDGESVLLMQRRCGRASQGVLRQTQTEQRTWGRVRGRVRGIVLGKSLGLEFWVSSGKSLGRVLG
jgi:hypothetical protein